MSQFRPSQRAILVAAISGTIAVHAALGGGLVAAEKWGGSDDEDKTIVVEFKPAPTEPEKPPEVPPEPEKPPEVPPEPEKPPEPLKAPELAPVDPVKQNKPAPPKQSLPDPPAEQPKPPTDVAEPPPLFEVAMDSTTSGPSNVTVNASETGNITGSPDGVKGGKGKIVRTVGGSPDGVTSGGVPGGTGTAPVTLKERPHVKKEIKPPYTPAAERERIEGKVKLQVELDEKGKILSVKVLRGLGYGLDEAAVAAMKRFEWAPAIGSDGQPMRYSLVYSFTFELEE